MTWLFTVVVLILTLYAHGPPPQPVPPRLMISGLLELKLIQPVLDDQAQPKSGDDLEEGGMTVTKGIAVTD